MMKTTFVRSTLVASLAAALLSAGCATTPEAKATTPPPELASQDLTIEQDLTNFNLTLTGELKSQAAATLESAKWELVVEGKVVSSGEEQLGVSLPAGGSAPFTVKATSRYVSSAEELKALSEKGGSLLAALRGNLVVKQDGKTLEVPFAKSRDVRTPRMPSVKMQELDAARYSDEEANMIFRLGVMNPNPFPLRVTELKHKVEVAGKEIAKGSLARGDAIDPASSGVFEIQVSINKETMGPDVKKLIKTLTLPYVVSGELVGELYTVPYSLDGTVKLNVSK